MTHHTSSIPNDEQQQVPNESIVPEAPENTPYRQENSEEYTISNEQSEMQIAAEPEENTSEKRTGFKGWGIIGVGLTLVLGKMKWVLALAKFAKLKTLLTMLLAVWAYGTIWGVPFAIGFVLLIFIHELGHCLVLRQQGIKAGAPVFIPFVGAVIAMKEMPKNGYVEALVGIGGPALGTVAALICLVVGWTTGSQFWFALASTGFLLNLFNMLPISPLDGGRITGVISRWIWVFGFALGIYLFLQLQSPILFLILVLGAFSAYKMFKEGPQPGYYEAGKVKRVALAVSYFGLIAIMSIGMYLAQIPLQGLV